jgi:superfamily I DNA and/or RNA helicase
MNSSPCQASSELFEVPASGTAAATRSLRSKRVDVGGEFERNRRGQSALNRPEAAEVLAVIDELWEELGDSEVTIGVVSPFRAHVDHLKELIADQRRPLIDVITVDTAHSFQGDEREVMVFSAVLAPSMPDGLIRHARRPLCR